MSSNPGRWGALGAVLAGVAFVLEAGNRGRFLCLKYLTLYNSCP
jgi:hypothetical protein